ncbi:MAG: nuclear transport factor 2 family protein [Armatimonadetes bacterium]|nr:nuclear transport factor 2 family protein [Armatimonadota bacterium]
MKRLAYPLFAVVAATSLANNPPTQKAIQAEYDRMTQAFIKKDFATFKTIMTDDFTATAQGKTVNRDHVVKDFQGMRGHFSNIKWAKKILSVKETGSSAEVSVVGNMSGSLESPDKKSHAFTLKAETIDTWIKVGKDWKLQKSVTSKITTSFDGK